MKMRLIDLIGLTAFVAPLKANREQHHSSTSYKNNRLSNYPSSKQLEDNHHIEIFKRNQLLGTLLSSDMLTANVKGTGVLQPNTKSKPVKNFMADILSSANSEDSMEPESNMKTDTQITKNNICSSGESSPPEGTNTNGCAASKHFIAFHKENKVKLGKTGSPFVNDDKRYPSRKPQTPKNGEYPQVFSKEGETKSVDETSKADSADVSLNKHDRADDDKQRKSTNKRKLDEISPSANDNSKEVDSSLEEKEKDSIKEDNLKETTKDSDPSSSGSSKSSSDSTKSPVFIASKKDRKLSTGKEKGEYDLDNEEKQPLMVDNMSRKNTVNEDSEIDASIEPEDYENNPSYDQEDVKAKYEPSNPKANSDVFDYKVNVNKNHNLPGNSEVPLRPDKKIFKEASETESKKSSNRPDDLDNKLLKHKKTYSESSYGRPAPPTENFVVDANESPAPHKKSYADPDSKLDYSQKVEKITNTHKPVPIVKEPIPIQSKYPTGSQGVSDEKKDSKPSLSQDPPLKKNTNKYDIE